MADWLPAIVTIIIVVSTWLSNCILLGGALQTANSGRTVPVAYFFIGSQSIAALLHVTLNLPPAVIGYIFGSRNKTPFGHIFCLYSTYLDTLFCNLTFLQTFFSSLDAYLRLRNPAFYLASAKRRPALWLKIGSPWLVAGLQAIGQLALSNRNQVVLYSSGSDQATIGSQLQVACLLPDANFLIIRTVIAYAFPLLACLLLVGLQLQRLHQLRNYNCDMLQALIDCRVKHQFPSNFTESDSKTCSRIESSSSPIMRRPVVELKDSLPTIGQRQATIETIVAAVSNDPMTRSLHSFGVPSSPDQVHVATSISTTSIHTCPRHGLVSLPMESTSTNVFVGPSNVDRVSTLIKSTSFTEEPIYRSNHQNGPNLDRESIRHSTTVDTNTSWKEGLDEATSILRHQDKPFKPTRSTSLWINAYQGEQLAVAINLVSCIIALGTWSPYILASLAHGLCSPRLSQLRVNNPGLSVQAVSRNHCLIQVTPDRISDFRWWAFVSSGLLLPFLLFFLDLGLREGCRRAINPIGGDGEDRVDRTVNSKIDSVDLELTNRQQTYRCRRDGDDRFCDEGVNSSQLDTSNGTLWNKQEVIRSNNMSTFLPTDVGSNAVG